MKNAIGVNAKSLSVPPIPDGFAYYKGSCMDDFTIVNLKDNSQFVWIPVTDTELCTEIPGAASYNGFYIARFSASRSPEGGLVFIPDAVPWTHVNKNTASHLAGTYASTTGSSVTSHLPHDAEILACYSHLINQGRLTQEMVRISERNRNNMQAKREIFVTSESLPAYGIINNVDEWTSERFDEAFYRCGDCCFPATTHCYHRSYSCYEYCSFRVCLAFS